MNGTRTHRLPAAAWAKARFPVQMRPLVVVLLAVCLQGSRVPGLQGSSVQEFPRSAWTAIAHGKIADAESLARAQPAGDVDAAAVLGHLAVHGAFGIRGVA
jgi:hypothetical protein